MRLILHHAAPRWRAWDATTGRALPVADFRFETGPLWRPPADVSDLTASLRLLQPSAPVITVTLTDGTPLAVEHVEFWLGRIGPRQRARLWWARLRSWLRF